MTTDQNGFDHPASQAAWLAQHQDHARRVAEALPLNKAALFDALARAGVTSVIVSFDGCGDSGQIEQVEARADDAVVELPADQVEFVEPLFGDAEKVNRSTHTVADAIETLVYALLEQTHSGWENNDGAYGDFAFDVEKRTIELDYNERYTESVNSYHEF